MSTEQHEALKLADQLDRMFFDLDRNDYWRPTVDMAGQEIRASHALIVQMAEALSELAELMEATRTGDYTPDSFTNQPANHAIAAATQYLKGPKT